MGKMPLAIQEVDDPSVWTGESSGGKETFCFDLTSRHLELLDRALKVVNRDQIPTQEISAVQFDLAEMDDDLKNLVHELKHGRGLLVIRGFPVDRYTISELEKLFWLVGIHFGDPVSQSVLGDRMGHVIDATDKDPHARGYRNHDELSLHTDFADVVAFMCVRKAKNGGESWFGSALHAHNVLFRENPEALETLYRGFPWFRSDEHGENSESITPWRVPVLSEYQGVVSCRYVRDYIMEGAAQDGGTPLTESEKAAIDAFDRVNHQPGAPVKFMLEPGEAVFINNLTVLHARTGYEDHDDPAQKRLLLRLWTKMRDSRPTVPELKIFDGENEHGIPPQPGRTPSFVRRTRRRTIAELMR